MTNRRSRQELTAERLRELFDYDPGTGSFVRRVRQGRMRAGTVAGTSDSNGYIQISINYVLYYAHRLAWFYTYGKWPEKLLDHINGDTADNRLCNLREADHSQNGYNSKRQARNTSGVKGVSKCSTTGKWAVYGSKEKKHYFIGSYATIEAAKSAYNTWVLEHHGEFAKLSMDGA